MNEILINIEERLGELMKKIDSLHASERNDVITDLVFMAVRVLAFVISMAEKEDEKEKLMVSVCSSIVSMVKNMKDKK